MNNYYVKLKAAPGFWRNLFSEKMNLNLSEDFINQIPDQIILDYEGGQVFYAISNFSRKFPEEFFWVETFSDDVIADFVTKYVFRNGDSFQSQNGSEYVLEYDENDFSRFHARNLDWF